MRVTPGLKILVLAIVIAAAAIRLFNLFHIPFTSEELNVLLTAKNISFSQLLNNVIPNDSNPAGIQVLLFFYIKLTGLNEGWIKLPFILAGIASVYLMWKIGREWYSPAVGLLSASTLAFMHFFIIHSQMALPYAGGLFFVLLMLLGWARLVLLTTNNYRYNFLLFITGAILSSYIHYFSLIIVVSLILTGLFYLRGKDLKKYLIACIIIIIAIVPHIPLTLNQLKITEFNHVSVTSATDYSIGFLKYAFDFSWIVAGAFVLIALYGFFAAALLRKIRFGKFHVVLLVLTTISVASVFLFSNNYPFFNRYSLMLFSFPLIIVFVFSFYEKINLRHVIGITVIWSLILIHSLIWSRDHYQYFYHSPYEETGREIKAFTQTHSLDSIMVLCSYDQKIADFYKDKYGVANKLHYFFYRSNKDFSDLLKQLSDEQYHYLIIAENAQTPMSLYALSHEYFSVSLQESHYNQGSCIVMKRGEPHYRNYLRGSLCNFSKHSNVCWEFDTCHVLTDTLKAAKILKCGNNNQHCISWTQHISGYLRSQANIFDATIWIYLPDTLEKEAFWVTELVSDTSIITVNKTSVNTDLLPTNTWVPVSSGLFFPDIRKIPFDAKIRVYLCNKNTTNIYVRQAFAGIRAGNPSIYWLTDGLFD